MKESTAIALLAALESNARATRALTKRLTEQALDTDAVSVTSWTGRWDGMNVDPDQEDTIRRLKRSLRRRTK